MSKNKDKHQSIDQEETNLDFKDAKNLTIEEAVQKETELKLGISEEDGVLDKYIKKHREDILSQKFDATLKDFENLDTATLDDFIQKQRQEMTDEDLEDIELADDYDLVPPVASSSINNDATLVGLNEEMTQKFDDDFDSSEDFELTYVEEELEQKKKKPWWIVIILLLLAALMAFAYWFNQRKSSNVTNNTTNSSSVTKSSSTKEDDTAIMSEFNTLYDKFFVDPEHTKLQNSEFDKLSDLESILAKLKTAKSTHYDDYKAKFDALSKQIAAIKAVNEKYSSDAIVNGEIVQATLKDGSNIDDLSSETLNTGNATLDSLIQSVIASEKTPSPVISGNASSNVASVSDPVSNNGAVSANTSNSVSSSSGAVTSSVSQGQTVQSVTAFNGGFGLSSATNLQRSLSRVPYNYNLIADSTNPAWNFNPGVLERIIQVSHERGYFSGNDYILEPVNIVNGNGYYNMFKTDGTYLFSINCKTGYFVGNAAGHADSLDY